MSTPITALYSGLLTFLIIFLVYRVIRLRRNKKIGLGDGGDKEMIRAVRVHGNAVENVPMTLLLMLIVELNGASAMALHAAGIILCTGRILHVIGVTGSSGTSFGRVAGAAMTWLAMGGLAGTCIYLFIQSAGA